MTVAILFPGQGSQRPGMLAALRQDPTSCQTLLEAESILGRDIRELDTPQALHGTFASQIALLIVGVATYRELAARGIVTHFAAGHSIGAFAAAVSASVISFGDALAAVQVRATMMQQLFPAGAGMAAVTGLPLSAVQQLVDRSVSAGLTVYVAMENSADEIVLAGTDPGLQAAQAAARRAGARAFHHLDVAVPAHCPLMQPVADELTRKLAHISRRNPQMGFVGNIHARLLRTGDAVIGELAQGVSHPVQWRNSIDLLTELDVDTFVQLPPGNTTTRLARHDHPELTFLAVADLGLDTTVRRLHH